LNFSEDHLVAFGPTAKQDYAVEVEGPIVDDVHAVLTGQSIPASGSRPERSPPAGDVRALLANRDNQHHRDDIEWHYREEIRHTRDEIVIANAYFFPGYHLLRSLRDAALRGVNVKLILQGNPDKPLVQWATTTFYDYLLRAGVEIHEYCTRPMHGKVAVV